MPTTLVALLDLTGIAVLAASGCRNRVGIGWHRMWSPEGEAYRERDEVAFGEEVAAATLAGLAVETGGLLGSYPDPRSPLPSSMN